MHTEAGAGYASETRLGKASHPRGPGAEPGSNLGQDWRPGSGSAYSGAGETSPGGTKPKENKNGGVKGSLTSSKIKKKGRRTPHPREPAGSQVGGEQTGVRTPLRERGAGDGPARVPLSLTQHTHTRAPPPSQAQGRYVTAKRQRCTPTAQARVPSSDWRTRPQGRLY